MSLAPNEAPVPRSPNAPLPTADAIPRRVTNNAQRIAAGPDHDLKRFLTMAEKTYLYGSKKPGANALVSAYEWMELMCTPYMLALLALYARMPEDEIRACCSKAEMVGKLQCQPYKKHCIATAVLRPAFLAQALRADAEGNVYRTQYKAADVRALAAGMLQGDAPVVVTAAAAAPAAAAPPAAATPPAATECDTEVAQAGADKLFDEPASCSKHVHLGQNDGRLEVQRVEGGVQIEWKHCAAGPHSHSGQKIRASDVKEIRVTKFESGKAMVMVVPNSGTKYIFNFFCVPGVDFEVRPYHLSVPVGPQPTLACPGVFVRHRPDTRKRAASETPSSLT